MIQWIAVDWGTSHCRAYAMNEHGEVIDERHSDNGMSVIQKGEFETTLKNLIEPWLKPEGKLCVVASGMVGARQGWQEVNYIKTPCELSKLPSQAVTIVNDSLFDVHIVAGVSQVAPADVMRGEETQIAGLLNRNSITDGVICLPGTHSKWATIKDNSLLSFQTFMTGEWYSILAKHSLLHFDFNPENWNTKGFLTAVNDGYEQPEKLSALTFNIRARNLLQSESTSVAARLSGLLIGAELKATQDLWKSQLVELIGSDQLLEHYASALTHLGGQSRRHEARDCTLSGLSAVYQRIKTR